MPLKKSLKIFIDGYLLNKEPQGTQTYIRELYKEVAIANTKCIFYIGIFQDENIIDQFSENENIKFIFFKNRSRWLRMIYEIPLIIKKEEFVAAHFQYVIPLFRNKKCKYIVTIHDILFNEFTQYFSFWYRLKRNFLFRFSAKKADFVFTVSKFSKESITRLYQLGDKEILITPNGVNAVYFQDYDKRKARNYINKKYNISNFILYVSRIEPRKNQQLLVETFLKLQLHKQDYELVLIGKKSIVNEEFEAHLKDNDHERAPRIHHFDEIDQSDLIEFYRAAGFFIFPSKAEGFGIPPIEAGALKIPVLCSNTTSMSDFDFFDPYLVNPNNKEDFEKSLIRLINGKYQLDLDYIQQMIKDRYSWEKSAEVVTSIIKELRFEE